MADLIKTKAKLKKWSVVSNRAPLGKTTSLTESSGCGRVVLAIRSDAGSRLDARSLHRFLDHYGCRENYHETLTLFWIQLVQSGLEEMTPGSSLLEATNAVVTRLGDSRLAFEYYSKELVDRRRLRKVGLSLT